MRSTATPRIRAMGMDPAAQGLVAHRETIDIIGDVKLWLRDLEAAWKQEDERTRVEVTRADAYATLEFDIAAPRQTVWEHLTVPGQWQKWWHTDDIVENSGNGRRGVGTKNHCMHGKDANIEETLDWRPVRLFYRGRHASDPGRAADRDDPCLSGRAKRTTRLEMRIAKPKPKDKAFVDEAGAKFKESITEAIGSLRLMLAEQPTSISAVDEPP